MTARGARLIDAEVERLERAIAGVGGGDEALAEPLRRDLRYWIARRASARLVAFLSRYPRIGGSDARPDLPEGRESEIEIVGEDEADPDTGQIAWTSPLARAIADAEPGETAELAAGGRTEMIGIAAVAPLEDDTTA